MAVSESSRRTLCILPYGIYRTPPSVPPPNPKYVAAKASSSLIFSPTELTTIHTADIPVRKSRLKPTTKTPASKDLIINHTTQFQLHYCPALFQKPILKDDDGDISSLSSKPHPPTPVKSADPFADPLSDLLIAQIQPDEQELSHVLMLNKNPVIAKHFILAMRMFKKQTDLLEKSDLAVTYACLNAWGVGYEGVGAATPSEKRLFAFFNSGARSGASQAHRHIQFLLFGKMRGDGGWSLLVNRLVAGGPTAKSESCMSRERYSGSRGASTMQSATYGGSLMWWRH